MVGTAGEGAYYTSVSLEGYPDVSLKENRMLRNSRREFASSHGKGGTWGGNAEARTQELDAKTPHASGSGEGGCSVQTSP